MCDHTYNPPPPLSHVPGGGLGSLASELSIGLIL